MEVMSIVKLLFLWKTKSTVKYWLKYFLHTQNKIFDYRKRWTRAICCFVYGSGEHHIEWSESGEGKIQNYLASTRDTKKHSNETTNVPKREIL